MIKDYTMDVHTVFDILPLHVFSEHVSTRLHTKDIHNFRLACTNTVNYTEPYAQTRKWYVRNYYRRVVPFINQSTWILCRQIDGMNDIVPGIAIDVKLPYPNTPPAEYLDYPNELTLWVSLCTEHMALFSLEDVYKEMNAQKSFEMYDRIAPHTRQLFLKWGGGVLSQEMFKNGQISPTWVSLDTLLLVCEAMQWNSIQLHAYIHERALLSIDSACKTITSVCKDVFPRNNLVDIHLNENVIDFFKSHLKTVSDTIHTDNSNITRDKNTRDTLWDMYVKSSDNIIVACYHTDCGSYADDQLGLTAASLVGFAVLIKLKTHIYDTYMCIQDRGQVSIEDGASIRDDIKSGTIMPFPPLPIISLQYIVGWAINSIEKTSISQLNIWDDDSSIKCDDLDDEDFQIVKKKMLNSLASWMALSVNIMNTY